MRLLVVFTALLIAAAPACKGKEDGRAELPPATGPGAVPLPELPATDDEGAAAPVEASEGHATGTLYPHAEAQLGPNMSGVITEILVEEGDAVNKGQVVFRQDARDAVLRRNQAKTAVNAAKVNLRATEVEFNRTKSLFEQNAVNRAQWDQVQARMDGAKVGVNQANVAFSMANKMVADATVRAPIGGVVTARLKNAGEMATTIPPTVVIVVQDQATLDLRFRLPERALGTIAAGDTVTANFDAMKVSRPARIVRVNPTVDVRTRTIELVAEIPNADLSLRPGLLASVQLGDKKAEPAETPPPPTKAASSASGGTP